MPADYVILAIVAVLSIGGGLFLLHHARAYRRQHQGQDHNHLPMTR